MSSADKEAGATAPRQTVDMDNPQDVARMLTTGYGLSGEGFQYHSFRSVTRDMPVNYTEEPGHEDAPDMSTYAEDRYAEPEQPAPVAPPVPVPEPVAATPVAPPPVAEEAPPPPPPAPPPPIAPEVVHAPQAPVAETVAPPPPPPPSSDAVAQPAPQPKPAVSTPDVVQSGGQGRCGLPPFTEAPAAPVPPRPAPVPAQSAPFAVEAPEPAVAATEDWAPVPKAQQRRGQRPTGPGFFFVRPGEQAPMARLFQSAPVPASRPVPKPVSKVTTMTKFSKNSWNDSTGRRPAPTDNSPTLTEVFMTLGGRATDRLVPKPSLREALLRKREEENGES